MAKNKSQLMNCKAHFFMNVTDGNVHTIFEDGDDKVILAAAFASAMLENKYLYDIISTAFLTLLDDKKGKKDVLAPLKEKYSSNKSNKLPKTVKKVAKKK